MITYKSFRLTLLSAMVLLCVALAVGCRSSEKLVPEGFRPVENEGRDEATGLWKEIMHEKSGIVLRLVPAGEFDMGSNTGDADENPVHRVQSQPFYIGVYEVTQKQWVAVMGDNPSNWKGDDLPVEKVSWNDAQAFCRKAGGGLRLPSEAEWEYACRAGSKTRWCFGNEESELDKYAWYRKNSGSKTHKVGTRKANDWGLYDMHGNVWEWCQDVWHDNYSGAPSDGSAWTSGGDRSLQVIRGGSWDTDAWSARSEDRSRSKPVNRLSFTGFRVAMSVRPASLTDDFEDGEIDGHRWLFDSSRMPHPGYGFGNWQHSVKEVAGEDGHIELRVFGPRSGITYGAEAWIRSRFDLNDGKRHLITFTWQADVNDNHHNYYFIQVTDGRIPEGQIARAQTAGTVDLLISEDGKNRGKVLRENTPRRTWSLLVDPAGMARLYGSPGARGDIIREVNLDPEKSWYLRFIVYDATSAGFPAGDSRLYLYSITHTIK